jgi:hypothetical protein
VITFTKKRFFMARGIHQSGVLKSKFMRQPQSNLREKGNE